MVNAKKCDRCGVLYEQKTIPAVNVIIDNHPYGGCKIDLCPECQDELENFVSVGKEKNNAEN